MSFNIHQTIGIYGMGVEGISLFAWLKKHKAKKVFCFDDTNIGKPLTKKQKEIFEVTFGERKQTLLTDKKGNKIIYEKGNRKYGAHHIKKYFGYNAIGAIAFEDIFLLEDILKKGVINTSKIKYFNNGYSILYEYRYLDTIFSISIGIKNKYKYIISFFSNSNFIIYNKKTGEGPHGQPDSCSNTSIISTEENNNNRTKQRGSGSVYYNSLPLYCLPLIQKIFRSPGVHPNKILKYIGEEKHSSRTKISSSTQLFFDISPTKNIIGITGTKGKGTTSSLIYKICEQSNKENISTKKNIFIGGNIGTPIFDFFDDIKKEDTVILEMSSFQLYDINKSPKISVLLRTDSEHLDWHSDLEDYRNAKKNIFLHQKKAETLVYFDNDEITKTLVSNNHSSKISIFSQKEKQWIDIDENKKIISNISQKNEEQIITTDIALRGDFHQENILAALAVAQTLQISNKISKKVISTFIGLPMRCELIAKKNGISFFNDSFSTIPETTISALSTFYSPVFLILGGSEKYSDFSKLSQYIAKHKYIKKIYLVGETAKKIEQSLVETNSNLSLREKIEHKNNFEEIFIDFKSIAKKGDSLLMSPACASFGIFKNYKQRGEIFNSLVEKF